MKNLKNRTELLNFVNDLGLKGNAIEIGVFEGDYSKEIIKRCKFKMVYLVDPWIEYPQKIYKTSKNVSQKKQNERYDKVVSKFKNNSNVKIVKKDSKESLSLFNDDFFDFIYIDANHDYEYVKGDIVNWCLKLKVGGVLSGHDYINKRHKGVKRAVDEYCSMYGIKMFYTKEKISSWFFVKR